jgi:hypothetical protein
MQLLNVFEIEARFHISGRGFETSTTKLYENMVQWGWIDGLGRQQSWDHWQRFAPKYQKERE